MKNAVNWFEIPVKNFDRATKFYETILGAKLENHEGPMTKEMGIKMAFFPADMQNGGIGGAIIQSQGYEPSQNGSIVYLNGGDDLSKSLAKVEKAGGKIVMPKTAIGENGHIAKFTDTEGNIVAFHSMN